ncbi:MAG: Uma2 family endonuclease [Pyrinomonadaceae bacterium]|nr:Uma2 family endonuclease [Pyrinomonadaceae bacterium]
MDSNLFRAERLGIKLEIAAGLPIWEASPVILHQKTVDQIRATLKKIDENSDCQCVNYADIYVQFPDGSLKRPDVSIFCKEPEELEDAVKSVVPVAIIEIISKSYEAKDLEISPPIYLANGVKDVVVFNPYTNEIVHFRDNETLKLVSPVEIKLECGCSCTV